MTGRHLLEVLWTRRAVVLVLAFLTLAVSSALYATRADTYASRATVVVDAVDPARDLRYAYYTQRLTPDTFNPYAAFFADRVRDGLFSRPAPDGSTGEVRSTTVVGTGAITVGVVGLSSDPVHAEALAREASEAFVASVVRPATAPADDAPAVRVRLVEPPGEPASPTSDLRLDVLVALAAALTVGVAGALAVQVRADRRAHSRRSA